MEYDIIIIGGGPAGLTAAVYASRAGATTLVLEKAFTGGQAAETYEIENFPGYLTVNGFELTQKMSKQAEKCGATLKFAEVTSFSAKDKTLVLSNGETISARAFIVAVGASHSHLGLKDEDTLKGKGISYCATCDGAFFKNKTVVVAGGGNTAVSDALYLSGLAKKVYIIHRRNEFRASPALTQKLLSSDIIIKTPCKVTALNKNENAKLSSIELTEIESGSKEIVETDGLFVAVGQTPDTSLFFELQKDEKGYIITDENMKTNIPGVFAVGDCRAKSLRQIVTACADGAIGAEQAVAFLFDL